MLTSFFGKSNPINFLLVSLGVILGYVSWVFWNQVEPFDLKYYLVRALLILFSIFLILLLDFINRKNKLTPLNTYAVFFFGCLLLLIPHHISEGNIVLANLFLLLSFRRLLSIQSDKNLSKKIFDSAIWISAASLFYFWSILFFIILFIAIGLRRSNKNYRYFLIPVAGLLTVLIMVSAFNAFFDQDVLWFLRLKPDYSFDINHYAANASLIMAFVMLIAVIWVIYISISRYPKLAKKHKPNQILLVLILLFGLAISILSKDKNGVEFFFLFFPLSILLTNALETVRLRWLKELILWTFLIIPIVLFIQN